MRRGFDPLTRFTRAHICADPFIEFGPPITLAYQAVGLLTTKMTTYRSVMNLKEDTVLQFLIVRDNDARCIRRIRAIAQQTIIDGILM